MIRCLIFDVTERRHEYGRRFETRVLSRDPTTLHSGFKREERNYPPGILCHLWLPFYERAYERLSDEIENQLLSISAPIIWSRLLRSPSNCLTPPPVTIDPVVT